MCLSRWTHEPGKTVLAEDNIAEMVMSADSKQHNLHCNQHKMRKNGAFRSGRSAKQVAFCTRTTPTQLYSERQAATTQNWLMETVKHWNAWNPFQALAYFKDFNSTLNFGDVMNSVSSFRFCFKVEFNVALHRTSVNKMKTIVHIHLRCTWSRKQICVAKVWTDTSKQFRFVWGVFPVWLDWMLLPEELPTNQHCSILTLVALVFSKEETSRSVWPQKNDWTRMVWRQTCTWRWGCAHVRCVLSPEIVLESSPVLVGTATFFSWKPQRNKSTLQWSWPLCSKGAAPDFFFFFLRSQIILNCTLRTLNWTKKRSTRTEPFLGIPQWDFCFERKLSEGLTQSRWISWILLVSLSAAR